MSLPPPPYTDPVVSEKSRQARNSWLKWFELIQRAINIGSAVLGQVSLSAQSASIAATTINMPTLQAGVYQVQMIHRVTTADGVSSSLTPFVTVTESGGTRTYTGSANTSNSTSVGRTDTKASRARRERCSARNSRGAGLAR